MFAHLHSSKKSYEETPREEPQGRKKEKKVQGKLLSFMSLLKKRYLLFLISFSGHIARLKEIFNAPILALWIFVGRNVGFVPLYV